MSDFMSFACAHGLVMPALVVPSEKIRRVGTADHPRSDNGAYFFDGERGWVRLWDGDGETHWWNDPHARPWTEEQKRAHAAKRAAERRRIADKQRMAAEKAQQIVNECRIDTHPYLSGKGLREAKGLVHPDEHYLFVPMRSLAGTVMGGQVIQWVTTDDDGVVLDAPYWHKKMVYGMQAKGAVLRLGPPKARETWLCEGFATGLSIEAALKAMHLAACVLVCFSDHNMVHVAGLIEGRKFVFADHDKSEAGEKAAQRIGAPYAISPALGEDANDWHQREGLMALCQAIQQTRRK